MRTLTNWFGNSARLSLANSALSLTVPVVVSIWLSTVTSLPVASLTFWSRSHASTTIASPLASRRITRGTLSSGIGNTTAIGCSWAITTRPFASRRVHDVAGIDLAQADAPADRRGDARVGELQPGVVDRRLVGLHRALVLPHQRFLRVDLLLRDRVLREQRPVALEVELRVLRAAPGPSPSGPRPASAAPGTDAGRSPPAGRRP